MAHGGFTLRRVLIPVNAQPDARPAVTYAFRAAVFSSADTVEMDVLHVGNGGAPRIELPERDYLRWQTLTRAGNPAEQIVRAAAERDSDLIAMTTDGVGGFLGALRGSVTEKVVHEASCPVLAIPVST